MLDFHYSTIERFAHMMPNLPAFDVMAFYMGKDAPWLMTSAGKHFVPSEPLTFALLKYHDDIRRYVPYGYFSSTGKNGQKAYIGIYAHEIGATTDWLQKNGFLQPAQVPEFTQRISLVETLKEELAKYGIQD